MADRTKPAPDAMDEHHMSHLLTERAPLLAEQKILEAKLKHLSGQIYEALMAGGSKRHQMMTGVHAGAVVSIVEPKPSRTIVAERLLASGVSPKVIADSTVETPRASYARVDMPIGQQTAQELASDPLDAAAMTH